MPNTARKPLVMVIDDDDSTRTMANEFLTQAGFDVVDYSGGDAALVDMQRHSPDIIVLDVDMPIFDGFSVCRAVRVKPGYEFTPILMLTGRDDSDSIDLAFEAGATDFSTKPINWSLLRHRLQYMLRAYQSARDLAYNEESLASAQRIAQLGSWHLKAGRDEMYWSDQLYRIFERSKQELPPTRSTFLNYVHDSDRDCVETWLEEVCNSPDQSASIDFRVTTECGAERFVRQQVEQVLDQNGDVKSLDGVVQDFTEKRRADLRIEQLAYYDCVTGIPNRALFQQQVDEAITNGSLESKIAAVMYIDMTDFKLVNDTLGHACGDLMLNEIAERILNCLGDSSSCVARMGADEFTVLLSDVSNSAQAEAVADQLIKNLAHPYTLKDIDIFSSSNIGIAMYPQHGTCAESLLKNADMAMSEAKRDGKNLYRIHDESMDKATQKRFRIESLMRGGLERNEFEVYFQPQVDLKSGKLYSAEALLRWNSPELGFVPPDAFIYIAEETGFIVPLGEWVLKTSCLQAVEWIKQGFSISQVAVNISALQFIRSDFTDMVRRILGETGLDPACLELEITESLLASDTKLAVETLRKLKKIGVQLSIDDFGTGYSSLSQLKHFPIDRLKLDQSFVQGITSSEEDAAITRAVIAMSKGMKVKLLAEGVETIEQLEFLKQHNCEEIQGYYISKPMPANELTEKMDELTARLDELFDGHGNLRLVA